MLFQRIADAETPGYIYGDIEATIIFGYKQSSIEYRKNSIRDKFLKECVDDGRTELKKLKYENISLEIMSKIYQWKIPYKREKTFER